MRIGGTVIRYPWTRFEALWRSKGIAAEVVIDEPPLRAELFSAEQMNQHGRVLAARHILSTRVPTDRLLSRLAENEAALGATRDLLTIAVNANRRIAPAGEWLLDNFYLIKEQIRTAQRHFPKGYSRTLPRLEAGSSAGLPRVYDIALETISHGDGHVDRESLVSFLSAYQDVTALKLGELWAIPIMLRLALIENLRRIGARIGAQRLGSNGADHWADQMMQMARTDPKNLILVIADMARSEPTMVSSFVAEFARRLQGQSPALALPLTWMEQLLAESGQTIEQSVQTENQEQAAEQVSISNSIGSLRFLEATDWRDFVETMSVVEHKLREDPQDVYVHMDFSTRDRYRHAVESMATRASVAEIVVARAAVQLAHEAAVTLGGDARAHHVGFYLIGAGQWRLERVLQMRRTVSSMACHYSRRIALPLYLGSIALLTVCLTGALLWQAHAHDLRDGALVLMAALCLLCTSQLAVALVNWLATLLITPHTLPRMDYSEGIPTQARTLVVIPTMLIQVERIEALIESLEVRFLANRSENLYFGLLTDFADAQAEHLPQDSALLNLARDGIVALNAKYGGTHGQRFYLFHRRRRWNARDALWMGFERKRGKLADLNAMLRGGGSGKFSLIVGEQADLSAVKYVITLDTDTQLPRDAARQFVGALSHPLNAPGYDHASRSITHGYGILQPRVVASLAGANRSRYARMCGAEAGLDPYTRAVSDVYQDLFGEGSYIGKGIYDIDAVELTLAGRLPDNRILSHDLLEGCYARAGLLSDVHLYEEDPPSYRADVIRRYRWTRGDWQLLRWLLPGVPGPKGQRQKNPLDSLARWKLFDNLRRSVLPAALTLLLIAGWAALPTPWFWTLSVISVLAIPGLCAAALEFVRKPPDTLLRQHVVASAHSALRRLAQTAFVLVCLPYEAFYSLDAILRTAGRLLFTGNRLLEWTASEEQARPINPTLASEYRSMWAAVAIAATTGTYLVVMRPLALWVAAPILLLWLLSPAITWWISRPLSTRVARLTQAQQWFLREVARRTWAFFDAFMGPDDHWLPPDNYQEEPAVGLAHRTSPTNMGLGLLSNLAAYDFGYVSPGGLLERTSHTLATMATLERHRGHFYNWYDTHTRMPLVPVYISTVDSGNLAGHLLTLAPGLRGLADDPIVGTSVFEGLSDTVRILFGSITGDLPQQLLALQRDLDSAQDANPNTPSTIRAWLVRLSEGIAALHDTLSRSGEAEPLSWAEALARQCRDRLEDLTHIAPWTLRQSSTAEDTPALNGILTLRELANLPAPSSTPMDELVRLGQQRAAKRLATLEALADEAVDFAQMEYDFLYDRRRHLLAIGYSVTERRRDPGYYDLLASESRLCAFVGIAQGQLPQDSWFAMGRQLTSAGGEPILVSWGGSMFEYLMPLLVMPTHDHTLLAQTYRAVISWQMEYARQCGVPWGISECGYNTVDARLNYQYRAFGVPGMGLKRGLADDLVVAPYASALALMVAPEEACSNLQRLHAEGVSGRYGFHEAIDYTPARLPRGKSSVVVRSYMAHHAGMSLLSLAYALLGQPMQRRFESDPQFRAIAQLLQERVPKATAAQMHDGDTAAFHALRDDRDAPLRVLTHPDAQAPEVQLLSNGRYHVMISHAGGGYSRWKDLAVTRWREDPTRDHWGTFCYLRDVHSGDVWSSAHHPTLKASDNYAAIFSEGKAEFRRTDFEIDCHTEIAVSPEDDVELRRITLCNRSRVARSIELTSYAEVVLTSAVSDALHPAFSNLFVQTEILRHRQSILCTRRPRSLDEPVPWMLHLMAVQGAAVEDTSYETDRARFIGRGQDVSHPAALREAGALSGTAGSVLDPIVAIRYRIVIEPEQSVTVNIVTGMSDTRDDAMALVERYHDRRLAERVFELAWTHSQVILRQINATEADAQLYGRLASLIVYTSATLRAEMTVLKQNRRGQSGLWGYSVSGDLPIVLLQIGDPENIELVRMVVRAHAYWRLKGLAVDLIISNEDHTGYRQQLHDQIMGLIASGVEANVIDRPGGIFVRSADHMSNEDRILMQSAAHVILHDGRGTLIEQMNRRGTVVTYPARLNTMPAKIHVLAKEPVANPPMALKFFNGLGGFSDDGREYVIVTGAEGVTPAPWVNVLANPSFGSVVSESGMAYTWSDNAHLFRLTPWHNDPVSDTGGEAFYLRDEDSGEFWSPMPLPVRGSAQYVTRHGFGYSLFEHSEEGIFSRACVYVACDAPVKFTVIELRNDTSAPRRISVTGYVEWVLGDLAPRSRMHVVTEIDTESTALLARNPFNTPFSDRVAFFDASEVTRSVSGDRMEFIGRNGSLRNPAAMGRQRLSGRVGAALDPCAAIQTVVELAAGEERKITFTLGVGNDLAQARDLIRQWRGAGSARLALEKVRQHWTHTLSAVQVETPDAMTNVMANGWLMYQVLACRLWARSGYYQSGGAFGFRDQLQDVMALVHAKPDLVREHLVLCAGRQFEEGDVQHWWHPPSGSGVRTHCSDDYLWLPLAVCRYVRITQDQAVLEEYIPFLRGRPVGTESDSYYDLPERSSQTGTLYEHCVRAIRRGLRFGAHGLPLIGSGDWNDGMNIVGEQGKGESIWLGFFLHDVLTQFADLARGRNDLALVDTCTSEAAQLRRSLDHGGWDGAWYRRAYFDDGTPLGSAQNQECQIDSIAQSWSVLSGAGDPDRARMAMASLDSRLVRRDHGLIQLLDPPFDQSALNPGYIKGYLPGVRENGGQYTHAAIWAAMAFAALGDSKRAWALTTMINPISHNQSSECVEIYKAEPYVIAADVYAVSPHTGRGGWTWYTGSAGWMYRLLLESLLGVQVTKGQLILNPCVPPEWNFYKVHYRHGKALYRILVTLDAEGTGEECVTVDGVTRAGCAIDLIDDHNVHEVTVTLSSSKEPYTDR